MPITANGFELKKFVDIVSEINEDQINNLAADLNVSPDTVIGVITNIFASAISDQEELNQATNDNFSIDKAEGKWLDDLVALVGIQRLTESPTKGNLIVTAEEGTVIPSGSRFSDGTNTLVSNQSVTISQGKCVEVTYSLPQVVEGINYTVRVAATTYGYVAQFGDGPEEVFSALETALANDILVNAVYDPIGVTLTLSVKQDLSSVALLGSNKFVIDQVKSLVFVENNVNGPIKIEAETVTSLLDVVTGFISVTNPFSLVTGRLNETDEELRARQRESTRIAGTATIPAIKAALLQLEGVTSVDIVENNKITADSEGRPPKSYECIVTGGSLTDIANTLFNTKPAGIETYGDILGLASFENVTYAVYFSRPVPVYAWVRVEYSLYDEEQFPLDGENGIKDAVVEFGNSLGNDEDIIPKRFYKAIYDNVAGINNLNVYIAVSNSPTEEPPTEQFVQTKTPISVKQFASFDSSRVVVQTL